MAKSAAKGRSPMAIRNELQFANREIKTKQPSFNVSERGLFDPQMQCPSPSAWEGPTAAERFPVERARHPWGEECVEGRGKAGSWE